MENSIECIAISDRGLPLLSDCDTLTAAEDFWHMDRVTKALMMVKMNLPATWMKAM